MDFPKESNVLNKTIHLTGIGLAVQAFYINLTLDSILGHDYLHLAPVGPISINPTSIWKINGVPVNQTRASSKSDWEPNHIEGANLEENPTGGRDDVNDTQNKALRNLKKQNKIYQALAVKTNYKNNEDSDQIGDHLDDNDADEDENSNQRDFQDYEKVKEPLENDAEYQSEDSHQNAADKKQVSSQPIIPRRRF